MTDKVTCPNCRGAKQMLKLGGMIGDCNQCNGSGKILACNLPKPITKEQEIPSSVIVDQVAQSQPHVEVVPVVDVQQPVPIQDSLSVQRRKAVYKRKGV